MVIRKLSVASAALGAGAALALTGAAPAGAASAGAPSAPAQTWQRQAAGPAVQSAAKSDARAVANPCWYRSGHWWCNNVVGAPVYGANSDAVVGRMYSNPSWFICRQEGGSTGGGGPHPNRWIYTQADNGAWGFMRDSDIYSETNALPRC
ncbi:hypothetical protein ABZW18_10630 [Streptomyces sp. NPDC004647]|uniref:hypothetical protein n=1 Tax=Streptomyces sp. NPDC004647 TaxID=3154671 RepID=UPI0033B1D1AB